MPPAQLVQRGNGREYRDRRGGGGHLYAPNRGGLLRRKTFSVVVGPSEMQQNKRNATTFLQLNMLVP